MSTMTELFGSMVFDDKVMEARLPKRHTRQCRRP